MVSVAAQAPSSSLKPAKLAHVVLRTNNLKDMVSFYKTFLAGHATYENDFASFITYDEEHHRVAVVSVPGLGDKQRMTSGLDHIAFTFTTLKDLMTFYQQKKNEGFTPLWSVNHGTTVSIYYNDPDGNRIETQTDCFDTAEETSAFMSSKHFAENPIGVDIDPEDMIRKLDAGESEATLKKRQEIGPRAPPEHLF